jgi:hypothetical protein
VRLAAVAALGLALLPTGCDRSGQACLDQAGTFWYLAAPTSAVRLAEPADGDATVLLAVGERLTLTIQVDPTTIRDCPGTVFPTQVTWRSSAPALVAITGDALYGTMTALSPGEVTITADLVFTGGSRANADFYWCANASTCPTNAGERHKVRAVRVVAP